MSAYIQLLYIEHVNAIEITITYMDLYWYVYNAPVDDLGDNIHCIGIWSIYLFSMEDDVKAVPMRVGLNTDQELEYFPYFDKKKIKFLTIATSLILSFSIHNYMQEALTLLPGFPGGMFIGYLDVCGLTICTYIEALTRSESIKRKAPWPHYLALSVCLLVSSLCANVALDYINYPTKVVIRSCKVLFMFNA